MSCAPRVQAVTLTARPELGRRGGHHVQVGVEDDLEMGPPRAAVQERAGLAAGLELPHREPGPGEVHHQTKRLAQVTRPVRGRAHREQLTRRSKERLKIHPTIFSRHGPLAAADGSFLDSHLQCAALARNLAGDHRVPGHAQPRRRIHIA